MVNDDLEQRRSTRFALRHRPGARRLETERPASLRGHRGLGLRYEEEATSPRPREDAGLGQRRALHDGRGRRRGDDRTRRCEVLSGVVVIEFPVNLGHGVPAS